MSHDDNRLRSLAAAAVVGIDAGKRRHAMAVRPQGGRDSKPLMFDATRAGFEQAIAEIREQAPEARAENILIGIEFAGNYGFTLAHFFAERGYQVVSVLGANSKSWKEVRHRQSLKSDPADALVITDLAWQGAWVTFPFLDPVYADLRYLVSLRERLTKLRNGSITRLRDVLQVVWPEFELRFPNFNKKTPIAILDAFPGPDAFLAAPKRRALRLIKETSRGQFKEATYDQLAAMARDSIALPGARRVLSNEVGLQLELLRTYERQIESVDALMADAVTRTPEGEPLLSIPKLGVVTAGVFLGCIGDPQAYESSRQALRVGGLSLVVNESGLRKGIPYLSKSGRPEFRRQMYMFAVRSIARDGIYRENYDRLVANNGGIGKSALVALMRKATTLLFSVAKNRRMYTMEPPR